MGLLYSHYFIPSDPAYVAPDHIFGELDTLLELWKLKTGDPKVIDLVNGEKKSFNASLKSGNGLGIKYPEVTGKVVADIMGPSFYEEVTDEDRYIDEIKFITGTDYRIHGNCEWNYFEVSHAPEENSQMLAPYTEDDRYLYMHEKAYRCSFSAKPPQVTIGSQQFQQNLMGQNFKGYWRTALALDCGKDLPVVEPDFYTIPNKDFVNDLEKIFKCKLIQLGSIG